MSYSPTHKFKKSPDIYGIRDLGTKRWLEGKLNAYNTGLFNRPNCKIGKGQRENIKCYSQTKATLRDPSLQFAAMSDICQWRYICHMLVYKSQLNF